MNMENTVNVIIESASPTSFSAYTNTEFENFALAGYGKTAKEAKDDFMSVYNEARQEFGCPELDFKFQYDTESFLQLYKTKLSLSGLQLITGINQKQLSHYITGKRHPNETTKKRIEASVRHFANELSSLQLV